MLERRAGDIFMIDGNRVVEITDVDNQAIYRMYPEEYIKMREARRDKFQSSSGHGALKLISK